MTPIDSGWLKPDAPKPAEEKAKPAPEPVAKPAAKPVAEKKRRVAKPVAHRAAKKSATNYFRANQGFSTTLDGEPLFVAKGELVHKDHPLLKGREDLFDAAENFGRFDIEQATQAPGETR